MNFFEYIEAMDRMRETYHNHKCPDNNCGRMWTHREADLKTQEEHNRAHQCPECGAKQYWKFKDNGDPY